MRCYSRKSAISWVNAPVHFGANRAEKLLVLQIHQNKTERSWGDAHFASAIQDEHSRIQTQQKLILPAFCSHLQFAMCWYHEGSVIEIVRSHRIDA